MTQSLWEGGSKSQRKWFSTEFKGFEHKVQWSRTKCVMHKK